MDLFETWTVVERPNFALLNHNSNIAKLSTQNEIKNCVNLFEVLLANFKKLAFDFLFFWSLLKQDRKTWGWSTNNKKRRQGSDNHQKKFLLSFLVLYGLSSPEDSYILFAVTSNTLSEK